MQRHLICHIYPRSCGKWRRTVRHLLARWDQFDGRRIVTIAIDNYCDSAATVQAAFEGRSVEFIVKTNNRRLQEVGSFVPMLERVVREPGITLYCHAKGATHRSEDAASHLWCDAMAEACLDYPALIDCAFRDAHICGAFRSLGAWGFPQYHNWHFAGTWFWFRNERAFSLNWRNVHPNFMGVEAWPGLFPLSESACLFYDRANTAHLYSRDFWQSHITPALVTWRRAIAACGESPLAMQPTAPTTIVV